MLNMEDSKIPTMLTLREAAKLTGLSYDFLRKACNRGDVVHLRCGSKIYVNLGKLIDYLNGDRTTANDCNEVD